MSFAPGELSHHDNLLLSIFDMSNCPANCSRSGMRMVVGEVTSSAELIDPLR